jgi:prepilin-type N-terminal cleavage/methylation domain-containing protein
MRRGRAPIADWSKVAYTKSNPRIMPSARPVWLTARRGFTLVELITVAVLTSIMAAVAIPALSSMTRTRHRVAARTVQRDLAFARERALATGTSHWVVFAPAGDTYAVLAEDPGAPGRVGASAIDDPATGRPMLQQLNQGDFAGVDLISALFDGQAEVGFDWLGRPLAVGGGALAGDGVVTLSDGHTVTVSAAGGLTAWSGP